ncbi:flagellar export protein FliJ [Thermospira aquatica]|uniref:Flagellar FliJ protein n=1 Tax=Thermospira aquatica TaxID=2828656 RepID=A0AAX3BF31_9SPIR|nr:flagellar export protein FliJ [Thermospira aquatica]URA10821.1 flagellar export protein FliJ [Thermospira aquatica]
MKRFVFPLQKLLEIRQKKEDQQKIALARASGAYQREVRKLEAVKEHEAHLREQIKKSSQMDIQTLRRLDYYGWHSKRIESDLQKEIEKKKNAMEKELALYTKYRQEKRAVEILKEKAWKAHVEAEMREEQQTLDELSQMIFHKKKEYADNQREEKGGEEV